MMAGLARSDADQEMRRCLRDAERALRRAADVCGRVVRDNKKNERERSSSRQALAVQHDLEQILGRIATIGRIAPLGGDSDLMSDVGPNKKHANKRMTKENTKNGTEE